MKKTNSSNFSNKEFLIFPLKQTNFSLLNSTVQSINSNKNLNQNLKSNSINFFLNEEILNLGKNYSTQKIILLKNFIKLTKPNSNDEIKKFVNNLDDYIKYYNSCCKEFNYNIFELEIKLNTRKFDYNKGGITKDYFIISLVRMQNELISLICKYNNKLIVEE